MHITAGVYLYAEDFPYNFADLDQKFLCGGLNRLRYGCLLFFDLFFREESEGHPYPVLEAFALFLFPAIRRPHRAAFLFAAAVFVRVCRKIREKFV